MVDPPIRIRPGDVENGLTITNGPTKDEPCAGNAQGPVTANFKAGATIPIKWKITTAHRGTCTVQLSTTGKDTDFKDVKKLDKCADENGDFSEDVKLPNVNCERCTLRFKWDAVVTNELYINCADISIGKGNDKRNVKGLPSNLRSGRINLDEI
ncbi:14635_t:CDS:1 [Funneliformis geosporum]|uniref:9356_t:CDS:1 n=1 Tax=Funneliformis geosporum TaxID=1117311 RepID=A0A9W4SEQ4_9GLOM|nr:9356_t:CDS:1 [Funneliformis geosporum]CAI2167739.1 14635_t:CDS:1 [Funneliformis geosporum]